MLKQQGHFYDMNCLSYSPDGQVIATGGDDGKVREEREGLGGGGGERREMRGMGDSCCPC